MKSIILYANRNTGLVVLSYLVAKGHKVKVITEDEEVVKLAGYYKVPIVTLDTMGKFDLFICCHGRGIIANKYLQEGKFINMHPCLFKYKGHNPIKSYIKNKDTRGSIESLYLTEEIDGGEVICRREFDTGIVTTYAQFYNIALKYYFEVLEKTLEIYE